MNNLRTFYINEEQDYDVITTSLCAYLDARDEEGSNIKDDLRMQIAARWLRILRFNPDPEWKFAAYTFPGGSKPSEE